MTTIATTNPTAPGQITNRQHQLNRLEMLAQLLGMLGQQMVIQHHEMGTVLDTAAGELWTVLWELREEEKNAN